MSTTESSETGKTRRATLERELTEARETARQRARILEIVIEVLFWLSFAFGLGSTLAGLFYRNPTYSGALAAVATGLGTAPKAAKYRSMANLHHDIETAADKFRNLLVYSLPSEPSIGQIAVIAKDWASEYSRLRKQIGAVLSDSYHAGPVR